MVAYSASAGRGIAVGGAVARRIESFSLGRCEKERSPTVSGQGKCVAWFLLFKFLHSKPWVRRGRSLGHGLICCGCSLRHDLIRLGYSLGRDLVCRGHSLKHDLVRRKADKASAATSSAVEAPPRPRPPWKPPRPRPRPPWKSPRPRPRPPWTPPPPRPCPPLTRPRPRPRLPWTQPRPRPRLSWTQPRARPGSP